MAETPETVVFFLPLPLSPALLCCFWGFFFSKMLYLFTVPPELNINKGTFRGCLQVFIAGAALFLKKVKHFFSPLQDGIIGAEEEKY